MLNGLLHYLVKYKFSKFAPTAVTQRQIMRAHSRTKENVAMADELVLSQKDEAQKMSFNIPSSSIVCCRKDHFFTAILA